MTPTAIATRGDRIQRTLEHLRQHTTDTTGQLVHAAVRATIQCKH